MMQKCIQAKQVYRISVCGLDQLNRSACYFSLSHTQCNERVCVWVSECRGFQQHQRIKGLAAGAQKRRSRRRNAEPSTLLQLYYAVCGVRPGETNSTNEHRDMNFTCLPGRPPAADSISEASALCVLARTCRGGWVTCSQQKWQFLHANCAGLRRETTQIFMCHLKRTLQNGPRTCC